MAIDKWFVTLISLFLRMNKGKHEMKMMEDFLYINFSLILFSSSLAEKYLFALLQINFIKRIFAYKFKRLLRDCSFIADCVLLLLSLLSLKFVLGQASN